MIKAVIFDLDGVLVDTEYINDMRTRDFLEEHHIEVGTKERRRLAGLQFRKYPEIMIGWWRLAGDREMTEDRLREIFVDYMDRRKAEEPIPYKEIQDPDAAGVMKELKDRGYQIAIASSAAPEKIGLVMEILGIREYVDLTVSGRQFQESKPNPEIYRYTIDALHMTAGECAAIEDSTYGIQAAKAAGLFTIAKRDDRFWYKQYLADIRIEKLPQLLEIFGPLDGIPGGK